MLSVRERARDDPMSLAWATGRMECRSQGSGAGWGGEGRSGFTEVRFELPVGQLGKMEREVDGAVWSQGTVRAGLMAGRPLGVTRRAGVQGLGVGHTSIASWQRRRDQQGELRSSHQRSRRKPEEHHP